MEVLISKIKSPIAPIILSAVLFSSTLIAAQVEGTTEFAVGETLTAQKLNDNLNSLQNAINDNGSKIKNTDIRFIEAESQVSADTVTGAVAQDSSASGGKMRVGTAASATGGRLWGIHASDIGMLGRSTSIITTRVKVASTEIIGSPDLGYIRCAVIRANTEKWITIGSNITFKPSIFDASGQWQEFSIVCDFRPDDVNQFIGIENFVVGLTDLSVDYFRIVPSQGSNIVHAQCTPIWNLATDVETTTVSSICSTTIVTPWPALLEVKVVGVMRSPSGKRCTAGITIDDDLTPGDMCCTVDHSQFGIALTHNTEWHPAPSVRHKEVMAGMHTVSYFLNSQSGEQCLFHGSSLWIVGHRI